MKLKRGQKLCKKCNNINGARAHKCKHCGYEFIASNTTKKPKTKRVKKYERVDWHALERGDRIKVIGRSGNYYVDNNGDKTYLTDRGVYTVQSQDSSGLVVYSNHGGFGYIYMGPEIKSDILENMYRSPHNIVKVNAPIRV